MLRSFFRKGIAGFVAFLPCLCASAQEPSAAKASAQPTERGIRLRDEYFRRETQKIADACLADIKTKADWEKARPELRRQFLEMMGLWPLPPRGDLKPVVTGKLETEKFHVEKLHFQSYPGLYVTANLYIPKGTVFPAPTILYVCGHGNTVIDGVSYGSKVNYQHHPAWFAEHGYVCMVLDTLQLGEIQGIHHGTHRFGMWWWHTLGYTPAGIECWNAMRALDYLETRKEVDSKRFGVTGRSGGGATSWWLAAADDRPQCIIPVAGIADLMAHVVDESPTRYKHGVIEGHCDCMYMSNTYRWDFPMVAALCAPRPLLLGNSDADDIFPVPGYRRLADKVRNIYELQSAGEKFALLETKGPHKDTPELRLGAFRWMNRWLKQEMDEITDSNKPGFTPQQLRVYSKAPEDALNTAVQEVFLRPRSLELPRLPEVAKAWWEGMRIDLLADLKAKVFRGWPGNPSPLVAKPAGDQIHEGVRLRALDFTSQEGVELRLWLMTAASVEKPTLVVLSALDEPGWDEWTRDLGPAFKELLLRSDGFKRDDAKFTQNKKALESQQWAFAAIAPRGIGPTRWSSKEQPAAEVHVKRRYALLGQTLDGQRVWDVRRAVSALKFWDDLKSCPLWLQGKEDMAGIVLYASLFEPSVARLDLWNPPVSHRQGPIFLNVRRVLDMPQALALAFPRNIRLYVKNAAEAESWEWPLQLQKALGSEHLKIRQVAN